MTVTELVGSNRDKRKSAIYDKNRLENEITWSVGKVTGDNPQECGLM